MYPDLRRPRVQARARDALTPPLLVAFAWLGFRVKHAVDRLDSLATAALAAGGVGNDARDG